MDVRTVVTSIVAVSIGVVLIGSLLVPIASDVMSDLTATDPETGKAVYADGGIWSSLIGVAVVCAILSLVVLTLYNYTSKN